MTRGDELGLIRKHLESALFAADSLPIPLSPAWQCLRAALLRVRFEIEQVDKEQGRANACHSQ